MWPKIYGWARNHNHNRLSPIKYGADPEQGKNSEVAKNLPKRELAYPSTVHRPPSAVHRRARKRAARTRPRGQKFMDGHKIGITITIGYPQSSTGLILTKEKTAKWQKIFQNASSRTRPPSTVHRLPSTVHRRPSTQALLALGPG